MIYNDCLIDLFFNRTSTNDCTRDCLNNLRINNADNQMSLIPVPCPLCIWTPSTYLSFFFSLLIFFERFYSQSRAFSFLNLRRKHLHKTLKYSYSHFLNILYWHSCTYVSSVFLKYIHLLQLDCIHLKIISKPAPSRTINFSEMVRCMQFEDKV